MSFISSPRNIMRAYLQQKKGSSGIWSDGHNLHYINRKHDDGQLRTVGNSLILSCSVLVES